MTRTDKIKQFFEQLPEKPTAQYLKETVAKTGNITDIADVVLGYAQAHVIDTSELKELAKARDNAGQNEAAAVIKSFADIKPERITWLWKNHIAIGKLTIFAGDPGLGKSQGTLDIAARLSRGDAFPDGSQGMRGDTIILSSEDDPGDTIRPRLDALDADVSRVHILQGHKAPDGGIKPMTLLNVSMFLNAINQVRQQGREVKLLVIDPLNGFMNGRDGNSNEEVREALDGICSLAEREGFAIMGIMHLNKGTAVAAAYRVTGSIAWTAKARSVWIFTKDNNTDRLLFLPQKNNLAPPGGGFQYSIQVKDTGGITAPFISWEGVAKDDIKEILSNRSGDKVSPEQDDILELLRSKASPVPLADVAKETGKSKSSVSNALRKLKEKGKVISHEYGLWTVPVEGKKEAAPTGPEKLAAMENES
jgi:DNA-binding transcriptional ArsR family regulator/anti-anti-sigma regulatory factor